MTITLKQGISVGIKRVFEAYTLTEKMCYYVLLKSIVFCFFLGGRGNNIWFNSLLFFCFFLAIVFGLTRY